MYSNDFSIQLQHNKNEVKGSEYFMNALYTDKYPQMHIEYTHTLTPRCTYVHTHTHTHTHTSVSSLYLSFTNTGSLFLSLLSALTFLCQSLLFCLSPPHRKRHVDAHLRNHD